jgi:hypothetical protein
MKFGMALEMLLEFKTNSLSQNHFLIGHSLPPLVGVLCRQYAVFSVVSAAGLEPATNGLKGCYPIRAFYDQEPALFHESFGHSSNEALGINFYSLSQRIRVQWLRFFVKPLDACRYFNIFRSCSSTIEIVNTLE